METIAIIGAGNGGKAAAGDLALQGKKVRLFEFPEYAANIDMLKEKPQITLQGAVQGTAQLEFITSDLAKAVNGADMIMICTQALTHERVGQELTSLVKPEQCVILNPGSTGGSLYLANIFRKRGLKELPLLGEFHTLTYGCRAKGNKINIAVKVGRVLYSTFPANRIDEVGPSLEKLFPGLVRAKSVLEAGLNNANPVIHPPIALLNGARFENEDMLFYNQGLSSSVAKLIKKLDEERMAILRAFGYSARPDPETCVAQGYAESTDYLECYKNGKGFAGFTSPNTLDHRYFHEDIGFGLVLYCEMGELLNVPTPTAQAMVAIGSAILDIDYFAQKKRSLKTLGLAGLSLLEIKTYLENGILPEQ
ncbi:NAD/NADP octopine/nopaline dehydrogenase family protein [Candidatus Woesearchaeota archaeon]|nr:NAD/NADP octopine/nopaline dehydrogenase family protein [Candidatus Woesearchaeota archaeon]